MTSATSGPGTVYPSGAPELPWVFSWIRIARSLVFCVVFCRSLFVLFLLAIVVSVLRYADSYYPFVIFKRFINYVPHT